MQESNRRIDRKKKATQNKIIKTAVTLFNQSGLEAVTMEQIAETADIAKGTLYNYFPSKEAIINAYLQQSFQENNPDRIQKLRQLPDTKTRLTRLFTNLLEGVQRQKEIFQTFMVYRMKKVISFEPMEDTEPTGLSLLIHEIISLGQANHELRSDLSTTMLEELCEFALIEAIKPLYLFPENFDKEESINQAVEIFLSGAKS